MQTLPLFRDDAYLRDCDATVLAVNERGGIILDRTVFYATSGGQPGDTGRLLFGGGALPIGAAVYGEDKAEVVHVPLTGDGLPAAGTPVRAELDWERRHRHMRMHTALHLMCSLIPFPVTGGSIGAEESRLDFDISDAGAVDKDELTERLNALVAADHPVTTRWISDAELADNPGLVRTMSVKPPMGSGRVRLVSIGDGRRGRPAALRRDACALDRRDRRRRGDQDREEGPPQPPHPAGFRRRDVMDLLVSPQWLHDRLGKPGIKVVDASWYLPAQNRDAKAEYLAGHIPGAVFFDIDLIADRSTGLPHMLPDDAAFAEAAGKLGISETDTIVVYDGAGLFSAPRVWWTFRTFGARDVRVLDGGLPAWKAAGFPLEAGEASPARATFHAERDAHAVRDLAGVRAALASGAAGVVDARSARALSRRGARAAARPALRAHAGRPQPPIRPAGRESRQARSAGEDSRVVPGFWRRSRTSRRNDVRIGRDSRGAALRARQYRQGRRRPL